MNNIAHIFILLLFSISNGIASIKYGYGKLRGMEFPFIYHLTEDEVYRHYKTDDIENRRNQSEYKLYSHLSIKQNNSNIFATVNFNNLSKEDYFIHRGMLTLDEIKYSNRSSSSMCGGAFQISTDDIQLDYIGSRCEFDNYSFENDWVKVPSQGDISFKFIINNYYVFLPKMHNYNINSLDYYVADTKWFTISKIYKKLFIILNLKYEPCEEILPGEIRFYYNGVGYCESNAKSNDSIEYFLRKSHLTGGDKGLYFNIRTNQVTFNANGFQIESPYKKSINNY